MAEYAASGQYAERMLGAARLTLLWSETHHDTGEPLLDTFQTEDVVSWEAFDTEVFGFIDLVEEDVDGDPFACMSPEDMGHNFVLSKNGHGAGFWDCGLGEMGDALHSAAKSYGQSTAYLGQDGRLYVV